MADTSIKDDAPDNQHRLIISDSGFPPEERPQKTKRLASLDIFRGLTVALMILVDDAGGEWPMIGHAPWNGCNLADFVMPFFLFIVGVAIALSLKNTRSPYGHQKGDPQDFKAPLLGAPVTRNVAFPDREKRQSGIHIPNQPCEDYVVG
ncbi:Heparan-alpha-glucosaminide N-acetyltransferase [Vitis vinifera]|uniref:Heparan-alpha-glucosaminide N-acetyltransferase n=1 Tax=Vitis vinifera TaxID=29760 RepID=A0A438D826_VITVI|nr:Heparan-alpha-glucosaminide N-acetyltransferase [Vitis vinifera]